MGVVAGLWFLASVTPAAAKATRVFSSKVPCVSVLLPSAHTSRRLSQVVFNQLRGVAVGRAETLLGA